MKGAELKEYIASGKIDDQISKIICSDDVSEERKRYLRLLEDACALYGDGDYPLLAVRKSAAIIPIISTVMS